MPKEISHWYLADRVKSNLPADSVFFQPVHTCENLFFLGAVAPDIPFYYLLGPRSARIQAAAEPFHRSDSKALTPVLTFLDGVKQTSVDAGALSLGAGILCHLLADTWFHPLVYYYSGMSRIHPGATARHRQFETALDLYFLHQTRARARTSLGRILSETEVTRKKVLGYLGTLFGLDKPGDTTCLEYAVRSHVFCQALFQKKGVYRMLSGLNRGGHGFLDVVLSLVYPDDEKEIPFFFDRLFQYRDPDTGQACRARISDLARETETAALSVLTRVSDRMVQQRSLADMTEDTTLPRVRPGMAVGRFWREKNDLTTDLYHSQESVLKC